MAIPPDIAAVMTNASRAHTTEDRRRQGIRLFGPLRHSEIVGWWFESAVLWEDSNLRDAV
jgi:hypothetical protein